MMEGHDGLLLTELHGRQAVQEIIDERGMKMHVLTRRQT